MPSYGTVHSPVALFRHGKRTGVFVLSDSERARHYRDRAEELRILIERWRGNLARTSLEGVAREYDALADRLERGPSVFSPEQRQRLLS